MNDTTVDTHTTLAANRTFSAAKRPDTIEMQSCVATADDELAIPPTPAKVKH